jgi:FkbM family methyltransferase
LLPDNLSEYDEIAVDADRVDFLVPGKRARRFPIAIQTPNAPWSYAAYLPIPPRARRASNAILRVRATSVSGEPWIGVLTRDRSDFICRRSLQEGSSETELLFPNLDLRAASAIVVENGAQSRSSSVTIESAGVLIPASRWPSNPPAPKGASSRSVRLGRYAFTVRGISADDVYFKSVQDDFEPEFQAFCQQFIDDDAICIDIGANIGLKALFLSRHVSNGRVVAVEAAPSVAARLRENIATNSASNVECVEAAIGDHVGSVRFAESSAWGHIASEGVEVPMLSIEELARRLSLPRVDFIKIDVEGFEFSILKAAVDFINAQRSLVLFEFNSWCQLAFADVNPKVFLEWIFENFAFVGIVRPSPSGYDLIEQIRPEQLLYVLHDNLVGNGCVSDLVVTNALERL